MLKAVRKESPDLLSISLIGTIDDQTDLKALIGETPSQLSLNTKQVNRINSAGVRVWMRYLQGLRNFGVQCRLVECSPAIVEQLNQISNFSSDAIIESICVPFLCEGCSSELYATLKVEDLKKMNQVIPNTVCPKCSGNAVFDDIAEEYFRFLSR